jgi:hypothetical protein
MAGFDAGFAGGVAVIAWFVIHSRMSGELWWSKLNVAGGLFYGGNVYSMGLGRATLAGASLLLIVYALAAAVFAQLAPVKGYARNALFALLYSAVVQVAFDRFFWPRLEAFAPSFFAFQVTLAGHLLYALSLTRFPGRFRSLALTFGGAAWAAHFFAEPAPAQAPVEAPAAVETGPEPSSSGEGGETAGEPPPRSPEAPSAPSPPHC